MWDGKRELVEELNFKLLEVRGGDPGHWSDRQVLPRKCQHLETGRTKG